MLLPCRQHIEEPDAIALQTAQRIGRCYCLADSTEKSQMLCPCRQHREKRNAIAVQTHKEKPDAIALQHRKEPDAVALQTAHRKARCYCVAGSTAKRQMK